MQTEVLRLLINSRSAQETAFFRSGYSQSKFNQKQTTYEHCGKLSYKCCCLVVLASVLYHCECILSAAMINCMFSTEHNYIRMVICYGRVRAEITHSGLLSVRHHFSPVTSLQHWSRLVRYRLTFNKSIGVQFLELLRFYIIQIVAIHHLFNCSAKY